MYFRVCCVISKPQSGHLTISFDLFTFLGFSSTTGSSTIASSTGSFVILIFGLALDFTLGLALGLCISSSIIVSITASFTGSSLLFIISSICSLDYS